MAPEPIHTRDLWYGGLLLGVLTICWKIPVGSRSDRSINGKRFFK